MTPIRLVLFQSESSPPLGTAPQILTLYYVLLYESVRLSHMRAIVSAQRKVLRYVISLDFSPLCRRLIDINSTGFLQVQQRPDCPAPDKVPDSDGGARSGKLRRGERTLLSFTIVFLDFARHEALLHDEGRQDEVRVVECLRQHLPVVDVGVIKEYLVVVGPAEEIV